MRPELSPTTQNGIIHFLIASHQARSASQAGVFHVLPLAKPRPGFRIQLYKTIVVLTRSALFSLFSPSDTANGSFKRFGGVKCARSMALRDPVLETAVSPSGVDAVH
ncbi:hypothetical protein IFM61392_01676 [Aspergillus lentulus]|nr:hypothetical protein IFM62136_00241 [Aspergillus lentulus]GFF64447.1 hypothetical protein IFM47457_00692 [Aspergillus lentulus]GFG01174.1 hypothetical protein IFM61392_01676 [Aspergillus lentulus]